MMTKMLMSGNQLRAARALIDIDRKTLAEKAGVNVSVVIAIENRKSRVPSTNRELVSAIVAALYDAGVEVFTGGRPGVRLRSYK